MAGLCFFSGGLDISWEDSVQASRKVPASLVVNCAATTDVDRCERDPDWAYEVNEGGPRLLARFCNCYSADLVHVSTDYVFDGLKGTPYTQEDEPNPLSVYAKTKLDGELAVRDEAKRFYIVRSSWIFGPGGKNFGSRVIEFARQGAGCGRSPIRPRFRPMPPTSPRASTTYLGRGSRALSHHECGSRHLV